MNLSSEKKNKETTKILLKSSLWLVREFLGKSRDPWKIDHRYKRRQDEKSCACFLWVVKNVLKNSKRNKSKHFISRSFRIEQINIFRQVFWKTYQKILRAGSHQKDFFQTCPFRRCFCYQKWLPRSRQVRIFGFVGKPTHHEG